MLYSWITPTAPQSSTLWGPQTYDFFKVLELGALGVTNYKSNRRTWDSEICVRKFTIKDLTGVGLPPQCIEGLIQGLIDFIDHNLQETCNTFCFFSMVYGYHMLFHVIFANHKFGHKTNTHWDIKRFNMVQLWQKWTSWGCNMMQRDNQTLPVIKHGWCALPLPNGALNRKITYQFGKNRALYP